MRKTRRPLTARPLVSFRSASNKPSFVLPNRILIILGIHRSAPTARLHFAVMKCGSKCGLERTQIMGKVVRATPFKTAPSASEEQFIESEVRCHRFKGSTCVTCRGDPFQDQFSSMLRLCFDLFKGHLTRDSSGKSDQIVNLSPLQHL